MRSTLRYASALSFVAFVSYGGCSETADESKDKSLRSTTSQAAAGTSAAEALKDGLSSSKEQSSDRGEEKTIELKATDEQTAVKAVEIVDGLIRLEELPVKVSSDATLFVEGQSEELHLGDWVPVADDMVTVTPLQMIPAPLAEPALLTVVPEATIEVNDGKATIVAEAIPPTEVTVVLVNDENEVKETTVPCPADCVIDLGEVAMQHNAEVVLIETKDEGSTVVVPEEADKVDDVIEAQVALEMPDRRSDIEALRAKRRAIRDEIKALSSEMMESKRQRQDEEAKVKPTLDALRKKRLALLDRRKEIAEDISKERRGNSKERQSRLEELNATRDSLNAGINGIQEEIKTIKGGVAKLRDEWIGLSSVREQVASLRADMRRLKAIMLDIAGGKEIYCGSIDSKYGECKFDGDMKKVELLSQVSKDTCAKGDSFGTKRSEKGDKSQLTLWVDKGCRAKFLVSPRD